MSRRALLPALVLIGVLAAWSAGAAALPPVLLPGPMDVLDAIVADPARLAGAALRTGLCALGGLCIGAVIGAGLGVGFLWSRSLELAVYPYALLLQTLPVVAVAPLLVVWLGYGAPVAVAASALVSFFPLLTAAHVGLLGVDPEQVELFALYKASRWQELRWLRAPAAAPAAFAGLRTAAGLSVIGAIVGEFVGSNGDPPSIGYLVLRSARSADTALTFAAVGAAAVLAGALYGAVRAAEALALGPYHPSQRGPRR